jgi:hypothetical protein
MHASETLWVRALLLGVGNRADAGVETLVHGVGALAAQHLLGVCEKVLHR